MLVENPNACILAIGAIYLKPGINKIEDSEWKGVAEGKRYKKQVEKMAENKRIILIDGRERVSAALVQKTFDLDLLEEWLQKAKGPIKATIKKQIKSLELEEAS